MENASKALIIAGAILLSILLISLGIMIYNQAQDTVNNSGMSQAEVQTFNNKFLKYEGTGKTGSEVKSLINEVKTSNADANNSARKVYIHFTGKSAYTGQNRTDMNLTSEANASAAISTSKTYKVTLEYDSSSGCVNNVKIVQQ